MTISNADIHGAIGYYIRQAHQTGIPDHQQSIAVMNNSVEPTWEKFMNFLREVGCLEPVFFKRQESLLKSIDGALGIISFVNRSSMRYFWRYVVSS